MTVNKLTDTGSSGILVSFQDRSRLKTLWNWVTQYQLSEKLKEKRALDMWDSGHGGPNRMAEYTALTCQDRVLDMGMLAVLILATKMGLNFSCFSCCLHLVLPKLQNCWFCVDDSIISGHKKPLSKLFPTFMNKEELQMVQRVNLNTFLDFSFM